LRACYLHSFGADLCNSGVEGAQTRTPLIGLLWLFHWGSVGFVWEWCHSQGTGGGGESNLKSLSTKDLQNTDTSAAKPNSLGGYELYTEQNTDTSEQKKHTQEQANGVNMVRVPERDIELTRLIEAWPSLPAPSTKNLEQRRTSTVITFDDQFCRS
jgi:hypothetical protein